MQMPSVGRVVHYQSYGTPGGEHKSEPRAAIITAIPASYEQDPYCSPVDLCVLNPTGMFFNQKVPYSTSPKPGHWSWPPRIG